VITVILLEVSVVALMSSCRSLMNLSLPVAGFEALTAVIIQIRPTMSDVTLCSRVDFHRRFGEIYYLRNLGLRLGQAFRTSMEFY
jgi:hypothetical protein